MIRHIEDVFDLIRYPAGEPHVRLKEGDWGSLNNGDVIAEHVRDFNGLGILGTASNILALHGVMVNWVVPYFPFGRHDRRNDRFDGLELDIALSMAKGLGIITVDPHSDVSAVLPHYSQADVVEAYQYEGLLQGEPIIAIPDAGATKKTYTWANDVPNAGVVQCMKKRDPKTGALSGFEVLADSLNNQDVVIIDDICDGGGTFIGLANELEKKRAKHIYLGVTHGLFTKGTKHLTNIFKEIWTLDIYEEAGENPAVLGVSLEDLITRNVIK